MPVFKTDKNVFITRGLFLEQSYLDTKFTLYTLSPHDNEERGYPSIYRLYLEEEDPTEYDFACKYFDGYPHWSKITECEWFKPYLETMRHDLRLRLKAKAIRGILSEATDKSSKSQFAALKYLADGGYIEKGGKSRVGRPNKPSPEKEEIRWDEMVKELDFSISDEKVIN